MEATCNSSQQLNTVFFFEYLQLVKNSTLEIHLEVSKHSDLDFQSVCVLYSLWKQWEQGIYHGKPNWRACCVLFTSAWLQTAGLCGKSGL